MRLIAFVAVAVLALELGSGGFDAAVAKSGDFFVVEDDLFGKARANGKPEDAEDLSGIACAEETGFPRHCLLVDDESQLAQFVTVEKDRIIAGGCIRLTKTSFTTRDEEDYAVFFWDLAGNPRRLGYIEGVKRSSGKWAKPEALLPLGAKDKELKLLVLFDGARPKKAARAVTVEAP